MIHKYLEFSYKCSCGEGLTKGSLKILILILNLKTVKIVESLYINTYITIKKTKNITLFCLCCVQVKLWAWTAPSWCHTSSSGAAQSRWKSVAFQTISPSETQTPMTSWPWRRSFRSPTTSPSPSRASYSEALDVLTSCRM